MGFYNTTAEAGEQLGLFCRAAARQTDAVLGAFRSGRAMTPSEVHRLAFSEAVPLTSVRRAITDLTKAGLLERTSEKRPGQYGRPERVWRRA